MTGQLRDGVLFRVARSGQPIQGACLLVKMIMGLKNHVTVVGGPTGEDGTAFVSAVEIRAELDRATLEAPMDYRPDTWTRTIEARAMTATDVERYERALEMWGDDVVRRPGEAEAVQSWGEMIKEYPDASYDVVGDVIGETVAQASIRAATWIEENRDKLGPR